MENKKYNVYDLMKILAADEDLQLDLLNEMSISLCNARIVERPSGYKYPVLDIIYTEFEVATDGDVIPHQITRYLMPFRGTHFQICCTEDGECDCGSSLNFKFSIDMMDTETLATAASELICEFARHHLRFAPNRLTNYIGCDLDFIDRDKKPDHYEFTKFINLIKEMGI